MKIEQAKTTVLNKENEEAMKAWDSIPTVQEATDSLKREELIEVNESMIEELMLMLEGEGESIIN